MKNKTRLLIWILIIAIPLVFVAGIFLFKGRLNRGFAESIAARNVGNIEVSEYKMRGTQSLPHLAGGNSSRGTYLTKIQSDDDNKSWLAFGFDLSEKNGCCISTEKLDIGCFLGTGNSYAVWDYFDSGYYDIHGYDFTNNTALIIDNGAGSQVKPVIDKYATSNIRAVYVNKKNITTTGRDITLYTFSDGTKTDICTAIGDQDNPFICGDVVCWEDGRGTSKDIYGYKISTGQTIPVCTDAGDQHSPVTNGRYIVYSGANNTGVYAYDVTTSNTVTITSGEHFGITLVSQGTSATDTYVAWETSSTNSGGTFANVCYKKIDQNDPVKFVLPESTIDSDLRLCSLTQNHIGYIAVTSSGASEAWVRKISNSTNVKMDEGTCDMIDINNNYAVWVRKQSSLNGGCNICSARLP